MSDKELIANILAGGQKREKGLESFYRQNIKYLGVMQKKYGLDRDNLLDAFSDSIIDFRDQVIRRQYQQKSKCSTYLYRIFQNKCIDILRKNTTKYIRCDISEYIQDTSEDIVQKLTYTVKKQYLLKLIEQLSDKCRDILLDWNDGYSMEEIALRNGLLNEHVARSRRYTCMRQLVALFDKQHVHKEI